MRTRLIIIFMLVAPLASAQTEKDKSSVEKKRQPPRNIYIVVEQMTVFKYKGGKSTKKSFLNYLNDSIPPGIKDCKGKVYVQFIVEPDSTISEARIIRGLEACPGYKIKIKQIIESMPHWTPGKLRGFPVRVKMTMPFCN